MDMDRLIVEDAMAGQQGTLADSVLGIHIGGILAGDLLDTRPDASGVLPTSA